MNLNIIKSGKTTLNVIRNVKCISSISKTINKNNDFLLKFNNNNKYVVRSISVFGDENYKNKDRFKSRETSGKAIIAILSAIGFGYYKLNSLRTYCDENKEETFKPGKKIEGLPNYTEEEVLEHRTDKSKIWITYKNGVYDITDFVESHPGGDKILLAAGSSIEPFWNIYAVHKNDEVFKMLEKYRIGNLIIDEANNKKKSSLENKNDPFQNDPKRHPLLTVLTEKPFNAETPKQFSVDSLITPNELFFVRHHMPVPHIDLEKFRLEIINENNGKSYSLNLEELKSKFPSHTIPVTLQCSGNKRKFMHEYEPVQGLMWDVNSISTAEWTGVKLKDVLSYLHIDLNDVKIKHVQFEGLDKDPSGTPYGASVPKEKVLNDLGDVLIAFKMNGQDIPLDHGFPLRIIVPGVVGARSVKWLNKIVLSQVESKSHWQQNDYKMVSPRVKNIKEADFSKIKAVQESPVQSGICEPVNGAVIDRDEGEFKVKGYAYSGGGNDIESVRVSIDGGKSWKDANLKKFDRPLYQAWSWSIWEAEFAIPVDKQAVEIVCVATDSSQNTQPETVKSIWNIRGLLNNAWHRINVQFR